MKAPLHLMDKTASIYRASHCKDTGGGPVVTYSTAIYSGVPCRINILSSEEKMQLRRLETDNAYAVYFDGDTDVETTDRIVTDGITMEVIGVRDYDLQAALMRVDCVKV